MIRAINWIRRQSTDTGVGMIICCAFMCSSGVLLKAFDLLQTSVIA